VDPNEHGVYDAAFVTKGLVARNNISYPDIVIPRNGTTFIVGESGTGKSTLLKLFNQTETHTSGRIGTFFTPDISEIDTITLRLNVILCGQNVFLFDMTVRDNFNEFRKYMHLTHTFPDDEIKKFLEICCAENDLDRMCGNLSGGERARVFLAICLSFASTVLMLDEPTSSLDHETAAAVIGNVKAYCAENEITLVIVSHDRTVIDVFADNIIDLGGRKNG